MAPGKKRVSKKGKDKNEKFSLNSKSSVAKGSRSSSVKKAKHKAVPKKKLKDQTSRWIEGVNKNFDELQPKLAEVNAQEKNNAQNEVKTYKRKQERMQSLKSDITDAEIANTTTNMQRLLDQT